MAQVFERGLGRPSGYVLPVQRWNAGAGRRWMSETLAAPPRAAVPGAGRLARSASACRWRSLPCVAPVAYPYIVQADPVEPKDALPDPEALQQRFVRSGDGERAQPAGAHRAGAVAERRATPIGAHRAVGRAARRPALRVHAADREARGLSRAGRLRRGRPPSDLGLPVHLEGYPPPLDPRLDVHQGDARSRRDRGQHPSGRELARVRRHHAAALRGGAAGAARHRQVHDRRPPHRHRRRQPRRARRRDAGRQPVPAPARPAEEPDRSTGSATRRCPTCSPACSSARPARRRASTRRGTTRSTSSRSRWRRCRRPARAPIAAVAGRPAVPQSAGRRHRQHPPHRDLHRQAVLAGRPDRPARPGRIPLLRDAAGLRA